MDYERFYHQLFKPIEKKYGLLDEETLTSLIGFSAGGSVSLSQIKTKKLYVTCELAAYKEQKKSTEELRFELLSVGQFSEDVCIKIFTALGNLSFNASLGDGHTIDVSSVSDGTADMVQIKLFSKTQIEGEWFGLYEVVNISDL